MFWDISVNCSTDIAFYDAERRRNITYREFKEDSDNFIEKVAFRHRRLAFVFCDNIYASILAYISFLRAGYAVCLIDAYMDNALARHLIEIYRPDFIQNLSPEVPHPNYTAISQETPRLFVPTDEYDYPPIHPDLAVLLSTSGTTGSPKLVRLSHANIQSNAESIVKYLGITRDDKTVTTLPLHYSFGFSVVNSHLQVGARIICSNETVVTRKFWQLFKKQKCTSFAGVPFSYKMLKHLKFHAMELPSLRTMTQAGGALDLSLIEYFSDIARRWNLRFFVMYGQTEASPRISYVPPDKLLGKRGSIGIPVPGGRLSLSAEGREIHEIRKEGELVYHGPNVMMGYAEKRADLSRGDELRGTLFTGDLAKRDDDGFFYITGRSKRILKIFGLRFNLDEAEQLLNAAFGVSVACTGDDDLLKVFVESEDASLAITVKTHIQTVYHLNTTGLQVYCVPSLIYTSSGKKNYEALKQGHWQKNEYN